MLFRFARKVFKNRSEFNVTEARHRIAAQLDTLRLTGIRHAVLGAFGCGAFKNPPDEVAQLYKEEINIRKDDFDVIAFAILNVSYKNNSYSTFRKVFSEQH